ncbi:ABC transporter permease [Aestuariibius insulae]|uniref:ABC transporter permease n=1 Tax=Aestuariibius insulae TaxID=2058287 RepID=UPI00345EE8C7
MAAADEVSRPRSGRLAWFPILTILLLLGPVCAGLAGTVAPAFGYLPAIGQTSFTMDPMLDLFAWTGIWRATFLSLGVGFLTTALSLLIVVLIVAGWSGTRVFAILQTVLSPLLSIPHAAAAFGLAFLIAPSGWIIRTVSPSLTGWDRPPDLLILQDPLGLSLAAGLIAKEVPFLLLMTLAALGQTGGHRSMKVAQTLGYGRISGWLKTVFPRVYRQIRLPIYVVLSYSMSVVDVAVILGPNLPPTLSVQIVRWMSDPDLSMRLVAAAAALWQALLVLGAILIWRLGERLVARLGHRAVVSGRRGRRDRVLRSTGVAFGGLAVVTIFTGLASLALWSFAGSWRFPDVSPDTLTFKSWMRHADSLAAASGQTALIAACSVLAALFLALGCLEAEHRYGLKLSSKALLILYLPILIPQTAFLPGLQTLMLGAGLSGGLLAVTLAHIVFVFPYVFLSLGDPYRSWDTRFAVVSSALGSSPDRTLWAIRLPMMLRPLLTALAVGFAVSVGQYLPTLLIGGGRVQTLTTEALALSSGGDRRAIGVYALLQTAAALLPFAAALALPAWVWRNRADLRHG